MKVLVVIAEYNPFHQGHKYHLKRALAETSSSHSLILMGGNFLQRGEPAIEEKFIRARKAVAEGADLVAELPFIYASSWARDFARGGVDIINKLDFPVTLSFGSESGDLKILEEMLEEVEDLVADQKISYGKFIRSALKDRPQGANDILALEYLRALKATKSIHSAHTVKRVGQAYHGASPHYFPSATSIRKGIKEGRIKSENPLFLKDFEDYIYSALLTKELNNTYGMIEGLDNRLLKNLEPGRGLDDYIASLTSKKYRPARIRRLLIHHLVGYTKLDHELLKGTSYLRPLAYNKKGTEILNLLKDSSLELVHPLKKSDDPRIERSMELDLNASRIYNLVRGLKGEDYKRKLLV
ncbi:MAG: nucleotidyltransferase family protein [Tissierellia bacterium]|nr:nucleotidyltransferase family protein [Tissierellia bacterium]